MVSPNQVLIVSRCDRAATLRVAGASVLGGLPNNVRQGAYARFDGRCASRISS